MDEMEEVVEEFLVESYENLDRLDQDLVALEEDAANTQLLSGVFRTMHTIKGTCGFLGFDKLESLTHAAENLLSALRDGELSVDPQITTALLATVDAVRTMLAEVESTRSEGNGDYSVLTAQLHALLNPPTAGDDSVAEVVETVTETTDEPVATKADFAPAPEHNAETHNATDSSIRVEVALLDTLMNLVGELVLARNQIVQITGSHGENDLVAASQRLNLITTELQESVMKTRMQPIGNVLSKFSRVVRDIALSLGKQVRIELIGKETELDKTINEAIKDPLTHLVRNSVDHGLEDPATRIAKGKNAEGCVALRAYHEGGQVNIEIQDDGAGIDHRVIKAKAVEKELITQVQADKMTEHEALQLIFLPGFSTASQVSNISGRGVGMDVVKTNIESIGGSVDVQTVVGEGTTFKIKIPLTLAIIPALLIGAGGERYAIPQVSLLELLHLDERASREQVEMVYGAPVHRLRGNLLPLCHLSHELSGTDIEPWDGSTGKQRDGLNIVVLQADGHRFGLVVDEIHDTQEIVVKPLDQQLKCVSAFAGATIMGDGRIALILDVLGLAKKARVISETRDRELREALSGDEAEVVETEQLLLVHVGGRQVAVPLSSVSRLEEFPSDAIEIANNRKVVQYRGEIMGLIDLARALGHESTAVDCDVASTLQVVVYSSNRRCVGLVVDTILDVVTEPIVVGKPDPSTGVKGSIVVQGSVTDVVEVMQLVHAVDPMFSIDPEALVASH